MTDIEFCTLFVTIHYKPKNQTPMLSKYIKCFLPIENPFY